MKRGANQRAAEAAAPNGAAAGTACGSNIFSRMKSPGTSAHTRYAIPRSAMPKPIEYCAAARPISTGDSVDQMRPRLYEEATAVARMPAGKLSLK